MIFAALAGLIFASLYIATGNLALPVIVHAGFAAVVFAGGVGALWRIYSHAWVRCIKRTGPARILVWCGFNQRRAFSSVPL